jgi:hypothetical protein
MNIVIIVGLLILAAIALYGPHLWAKAVLSHYGRREYFSGNGMELARRLLDRSGIPDVRVETTSLGDHYDPQAKAIRLSPERCGRNTLTAVVVAAHEVGHAIQDHTGYPPFRSRTRWIVVGSRLERIGAGVMVAVPVVAMITRVPAAGLLMFLGGLATLCIPLVIHLFTLPTEFDASFGRALPILSTGEYIPPEDIPGARRILLACSLTYVASALAGLLNVWRWIRILRR